MTSNLKRRKSCQQICLVIFARAGNLPCNRSGVVCAWALHESQLQHFHACLRASWCTATLSSDCCMSSNAIPYPRDSQTRRQCSAPCHGAVAAKAHSSTQIYLIVGCFNQHFTLGGYVPEILLDPSDHRICSQPITLTALFFQIKTNCTNR